MANLYGVAGSGAGLTAAVGYSAIIVTSPDGVTWTSQNSGTVQALRNIIFDDGQFVVVGDAGTILVSADARAWTAYTLAPALELSAIAPANGGYLLGANNGYIVQIGSLRIPGLSSPSLSAGGFDILFTGAPRQSYRLQYSTDLAHWSDLYSFTNAYSTTNFFDPAPPTGHRFYRIVRY